MGKESKEAQSSVDLARANGSAQSKRPPNETTLASPFSMKGVVGGCVILEGSVREDNSDGPSYPYLHFGISIFRREFRKIGTMAEAISLPYHCILLCPCLRLVIHPKCMPHHSSKYFTPQPMLPKCTLNLD